VEFLNLGKLCYRGLMKRFLLTILMASLGTIEPSFAQDEAVFDASAAGTERDVVAFVGRQVFVRQDKKFPPEQDPEADEIILYMDGRYEARYEIINLVAGDYESETIDFYAYDHYGTPKFSKTNEAILLFVHDGPKTHVHSKYNYYEVHRTTDGDWAACGNTWVQNDPEETEKEPLEKISFLEPVEVNIPSFMVQIEEQLEPDEIITDAERAEWQTELDEENAKTDGFYQAPIWDRDGNTATCLMGTRVKDLFEFQNETRFRPDRRSDICRERFADKLDAWGNNYKAKDAILEDCESLLKIQNLP